MQDFGHIAAARRNGLHPHPAVRYNLRRSGKCKLANLFFLEQWQHLMIASRTAIECHFAWMNDISA
jgi:hypothetical protein